MLDKISSLVHEKAVSCYNTAYEKINEMFYPDYTIVEKISDLLIKLLQQKDSKERTETKKQLLQLLIEAKAYFDIKDVNKMNEKEVKYESFYSIVGHYVIVGGLSYQCNTFINLAVQTDDIDIVEAMLPRQNNFKVEGISLRNDDGDSPLHIAVRNNNTKIVSLLLSSGAEPNIIGRDGQYPLDIAVKNGNQEIVEILKGHGAKRKTDSNPTSPSNNTISQPTQTQVPQSTQNGSNDTPLYPNLGNSSDTTTTLPQNLQNNNITIDNNTTPTITQGTTPPTNPTQVPAQAPVTPYHNVSYDTQMKQKLEKSVGLKLSTKNLIRFAHNITRRAGVIFVINTCLKALLEVTKSAFAVNFPTNSYVIAAVSYSLSSAICYFGLEKRNIKFTGILYPLNIFTMGAQNTQEYGDFAKDFIQKHNIQASSQDGIENDIHAISYQTRWTDMIFGTLALRGYKGTNITKS